MGKAGPAGPSKHVLCKPNLDAFNRALEIAGTSAARAAFFDDSHRNIAGAKKASNARCLKCPSTQLPAVSSITQPCMGSATSPLPLFWAPRLDERVLAQAQIVSVLVGEAEPCPGADAALEARSAAPQPPHCPTQTVRGERKKIVALVRITEKSAHLESPQPAPAQDIRDLASVMPGLWLWTNKGTVAGEDLAPQGHAPQAAAVVTQFC